MTSCFKRCRMIQSSLAAIGFIAAGCLVFFMTGQHAAVRLLFAFMIAGAGLALGKLFASRYAANKHASLLKILFESADPDRFIEEYSQLVRRCKEDSVEYIVTGNYLSRAFAAKGDFTKAIATLKSLRPDEQQFHQLGLTALVSDNLCQCFLWGGDVDGANKQYELLENMMDIALSRQPYIAKNLGQNLRLYRQHLNLLQKLPVDNDYLKEEIETSTNELHRSGVKLLLAKSLLACGRASEAAPLLNELAKKATGLFYGVSAAGILKGQ